VIGTDDMLAKIKAAVDTRQSSDFLIIARTDSLACNGLDDAVDRAGKYGEAGADILFVEAPQTREQMEEIPRLLRGKPLLINMAPLTPNLSMEELKAMGYALVILPGVCIAAAITACNEELGRLKDTGRQRDFEEWTMSFQRLNSWLKAPYYMGLEQKYKSE